MRWVAMLLCLVCASARADDWGVKRDPFDRAVIARYKAILTAFPHDTALTQLTALYKGYRSVALLETEYQQQLAAKPDDWATLVVLARMPRDRTAALGLWKRALAANPSDARGWLALGKISHDAKDARAAFQRAVETSPNPRDTRIALIELVGAARSAGDHATVDAAYARLIALAPKDGQLWLDRGDAQLAATKPAPALASFATAESLLGSDPERRLTAMTSRGVALERLARIDEALAQWDATLDKTPSSSSQRRDLVSRIIAAERARHQLPAAIARLEKRWKESARGFYEWDLLGDLQLEVHDGERALTAFRKAIARAPTEVETQRKLIRLLDQLRPDEVLEQHETAARIAPGDANLQIDLAKRYHDVLHDHVKAYAVLDRLARRHARSAGVRQVMAELFSQWDDRTRALFEYTAVADLEPAEPDHAVTLGDMYWANEQPEKAVAAWLRLSKINTAPTQLRLGDLLARRDLWPDAKIAYSRAVQLAPTTAEAWRGRARANAELGHAAAAVSDARRAVALIGLANIEDGQRMRFELVRSLGRAQHDSHVSDGPLNDQVIRWRFAFEHGDIAAGYLLVAHDARIQGPHHETLVELYRRVPTDDALGIAVARSYGRNKHFDRARAELEKIALRSPRRAEDIHHLLAQVEEDRARAAEDKLREEEGFREPRGPQNLVDRRSKVGVRFGIGGDVRGTSSALIDLGIYGTRRVARGTALEWRLGWAQRDDDTAEINSFAGAFAIVRRVLSTRRFELAAGAGPRFEVRYGNDRKASTYGRAGVAVDAMIELMPRSLPANLGLRFQRALTDEVRGSAVFVELGFEVR